MKFLIVAVLFVLADAATLKDQIFRLKRKEITRDGSKIKRLNEVDQLYEYENKIIDQALEKDLVYSLEFCRKHQSEYRSRVDPDEFSKFVEEHSNNPMANIRCTDPTPKFQALQKSNTSKYREFKYKEFFNLMKLGITSELEIAKYYERFTSNYRRAEADFIKIENMCLDSAGGYYLRELERLDSKRFQWIHGELKLNK